MTNHYEIGRVGEEIAVQFLSDHGYSILERNFRFHHQEIDVIAKASGIILFVEVKTRISERAGAGMEQVTPDKQIRIRRVANFYLTKVMAKDTVIRFDVFSILLDKTSLLPRKILHIKNAF